MHDDALVAWINSGAKADLSADDQAAKQASEFSRRFTLALNPTDDLGATEEDEQRAIAANVYAVHVDLNRLGEVAYSDVWRTLDSRSRAAIKKYVTMQRENSNGK